MNRLLKIVILLSALLHGCASVPSINDKLIARTQQEAISKYFDSLELDFVEGIWVSDDENYLLAISSSIGSKEISATYVGIIIQSTYGHWLPGEIKFYLGGARNDGTYDAVYYMADKTYQDVEFQQLGPNLLQTWLQGQEEPSFFFRTHPTYDVKRYPKGPVSVPSDLDRLSEDMSSLRARALRGDAVAQNSLGVAYELGDGLAVNYETAFYWYAHSAVRGNQYGQLNLGRSFLHGRGTWVDSSAALRWLKKAARSGNAHANFQIGDVYRDGVGVDKDWSEAVRWYRAAATQSDVGAMWRIAVCYFYGGPGLEKSGQLFLDWTLQAARRGHIDAQRWMGFLYSDPKRWPEVPIQQDQRAGFQWFEKAAKQDDSESQLIVAKRHLYGHGTEKNPETAISWAKRAIQSGTVEGQEVLDLAREELANQRKAEEEARRIAREALEKKRRETEQARRAAIVEESLEKKKQSRNDPVLFGTGSGFFIAENGWIATNLHVIEECDAIRVNVTSGPLSPIEIKKDPNNDLALLRVNEAAPEHARLRVEPPIEAGELVVVAGYPLKGVIGDQLNVSDGIVSSLIGLNNDRSMFQITAPVQPGNSGGPVLDIYGNVIGVTTGKLDGIQMVAQTGVLPENVNFGISAAILNLFLTTEGLSPKSGSLARELAVKEIARVAKGFTVSIDCLVQQ